MLASRSLCTEDPVLAPFVSVSTVCIHFAQTALVFVYVYQHNENSMLSTNPYTILVSQFSDIMW